MTTDPTQDHIQALATAAIDARLDLADAIRAACPGRHSFVQHPDGQPEWCDACGRGELGTRYGTPASDVRIDLRGNP